jgi:hypothetical protein
MKSRPSSIYPGLMHRPLSTCSMRDFPAPTPEDRRAGAQILHHNEWTLDGVAPWLRVKFLNTLCRLCSHRALLTISVQILLYYDRTGAPRYHGRPAEVWKAEHKGCEVVVKALRVYTSSNLPEVARVFSPLTLSAQGFIRRLLHGNPFAIRTCW